MSLLNFSNTYLTWKELEESKSIERLAINKYLLDVVGDPYYGHVKFRRIQLNGTGLFHPYWLQFEPPPFWINGTFGLFVALAGVLSVIGNGLVVFVFVKSPTLRSQKLFITNLALSDFLSPLLTYHMFTMSSLEGIWSFSITACQFYALIQGWFGIVSIVSLAAVAGERYLAMMKPSKYRDISVPKKALFALCIWIYSFMVVCLPLFGIGKYVAGGFLTTCCFDYIDKSMNTKIFILYLFFFGLVVPMAVIIFAYVKIYLTVRSNVNRNEENYEEDCAQSSTAPYIKGKDIRTAKLVLLVISVFVAAWTPYALVALLGQLGPAGSVSPWMAMIPSVFAKSSTLYNPVLYAFKDSRFKRAVRKYVCSSGLSDMVDRTDSLTTQSDVHRFQVNPPFRLSSSSLDGKKATTRL